MYKINEWKERYEVSIKGREPKGDEDLRVGPLNFIRLKVYGHKQGAGYRRLLSIAKDKTMEVFGIFCKFLEISGNQPKDLRGLLLNERDEPATEEDLAFILDVPLPQIHNAITILSDEKLGWISTKNEHNITQVNTIKVNTSIRKNPEKSGKGFTPPTLEQIKEYIKQNNYDVNAEKFLKYFSESDWVDSKGNKVRNWKQKVITWSGGRTGNTNPAKTTQPKLCIIDKEPAVCEVKTGVYLCEKCKSAFDSAPAPTFKGGKPFPKHRLDRGQIEAMVLKEKARMENKNRS